MEGGDIGEADNPLGVVLDGKSRKLVEIMYHSVATTSTENCANLGVGEGRHKVRKTFGMGAAEMSILAESVGINDGIVAKAAKHLGG